MEKQTVPPSDELQREKMLRTPVPKLVTLLSVPTVATQMITIVYNTADAYFVSKIDTNASAAVGVAFSLMSLIHAFGYGVGMGCGSLVSRLLGEKRKDEADKVASTACLEAFILGLVVCVFGQIFLRPLMTLFGSTEAMLDYTCAYARYVLAAAPMMCFTFVLIDTLRAEGKAKLSMFGTVGGGLLNVVLDPLFIFKFGMGTAGAGLATAISQVFTLVVILYFYIAKKSIVTPSFSKISKNVKTYTEIVTTGMPTIFRQGLATLASTLLTRGASAYSETPEAAIAAITVSNKVYLLVRSFILGIGQGFQPVAGYNFGAGDVKRTKQSFWFATGIGTAVCVLSAGLIALFPQSVIAFFRDDPDVIRIGVPALLYACAVMPLMAFSTYVNQLFQCLGVKFPATFLASCRQGICFLPLIFTLPPAFGLAGVQAAQPGADLLTFFISIPFIVVFLKKKLYDRIPKEKNK